MRRFFREVYMDSVFPILNSAELPPYIWSNDARDRVRILSSQFQNILAYGNCAHSTSGSQKLGVIPKRHDNSLSLRN